MHCPFCGAEDTKVIDSRLAGEGSAVRRRRECLSCHERFTTFETPELVMPRLVKNDGRREPFDEEKLRAGMQRALEKRPVNTDAIEDALNRILKKLRAMGEREISSQQVGELVMQELRDLDQVAYVRFACVPQFRGCQCFPGRDRKAQERALAGNETPATVPVAG